MCSFPGGVWFIPEANHLQGLERNNEKRTKKSVFEFPIRYPQMDEDSRWDSEAVCDRLDGSLSELATFSCYESQLNFSTASQEEDDYYNKRKIARDPMSHRIIEKRRRDRMNNCLADLSRLIPADYLKKGRGRIEKTEIIEMAIKHMRHLQTIIATTRTNNAESEKNSSSTRPPVVLEHYRLGYLECLSEAMHFLVEIQGFFAGDALCVQMMNHLHRHCDNIMHGDTLNFPRQQNGDSTSHSSNSTGSGASPPLGMSNSTGGHSDEHNEFGPYSSENDEPGFVQTKCSMSSGVGSFAIKEESEGSSQLRDMLTGSSRKSVSSVPDSALSSEEHHMYKFKNTIKQRYNESRNQDDDEPPAKKLKKEEFALMAGRLSFGHKALVKPMISATQPAPSDVKSAGIPIFALHTNGGFYVPLTVEQQTLLPYLSGLTEKPPHKATLHPVTISVNFHQQDSDQR